MAAPNIFVSYYSTDKTHTNYQFATQLIEFLRAKGAEVLAENAASPGNQAQSYFNAQVSRCQWYILIQTPEALQAQRIRLEVEAVLKMVEQQRLEGVLSLMLAPCVLTDMPPTWSAIRIYDASEDYPRALAGILIALNHVRFQAPPPTILPAIETPSRVESMQRLFSSRFQEWHNRTHLHPMLYSSVWRKRRILYTAFAVTLAFLVIFTSVLISNHRAIPGKPGKSSPGNQITATTTTLPTSPAALYTYVTSKHPTVNDPLSAQDSDQWDNTGSCAFAQGTYHVIVNTAYGYTNCIERAKSFSNFAYQVQMTIVTGDAGGLIFRTDDAITTYYRFSLDTSSQGIYRLLNCNKCSIPNTLIKKVMPVKVNQTYTMTVIAQKSILYLFINGQFLVSTPDGTAQSGELGVYTYEFTHSTEVLFSNMKVWTL